MNRSVKIFWASQKYMVIFKDGREVAHTRAYVTWAGTQLDAKFWLTHGHEPTAQEELEELAI
jgi:hypothetical protein